MTVSHTNSQTRVLAEYPLFLANPSRVSGSKSNLFVVSFPTLGVDENSSHEFSSASLDTVTGDLCLSCKPQVQYVASALTTSGVTSCSYGCLRFDTENKRFMLVPVSCLLIARPSVSASSAVTVDESTGKDSVFASSDEKVDTDNLKDLKLTTSAGNSKGVHGQWASFKETLFRDYQTYILKAGRNRFCHMSVQMTRDSPMHATRGRGLLALADGGSSLKEGQLKSDAAVRPKPGKGSDSAISEPYFSRLLKKLSSPGVLSSDRDPLDPNCDSVFSALTIQSQTRVATVEAVLRFLRFSMESASSSAGSTSAGSESYHELSTVFACLSHIKPVTEIVKYLQSKHMASLFEILDGMSAASKSEIPSSQVFFAVLEAVSVNCQGLFVLKSVFCSDLHAGLLDARDAVLVMIHTGKEVTHAQVQGLVTDQSLHGFIDEKVLSPLCLLDAQTGRWKMRGKPAEWFKGAFPQVAKDHGAAVNKLVNDMKARRTDDKHKSGLGSTAFCGLNNRYSLERALIVCLAKVIMAKSCSVSELKRAVQSSISDVCITEEIVTQIVSTYSGLFLRKTSGVSLRPSGDGKDNESLARETGSAPARARRGVKTEDVDMD